MNNNRKCTKKKRKKKHNVLSFMVAIYEQHKYAGKFTPQHIFLTSFSILTSCTLMANIFLSSWLNRLLVAPMRSTFCRINMLSQAGNAWRSGLFMCVCVCVGSVVVTAVVVVVLLYIILFLFTSSFSFHLPSPKTTLTKFFFLHSYKEHERDTKERWRETILLVSLAVRNTLVKLY